MNKKEDTKRDRINDSLKDIIKLIETHRNNAYRKVNEELVTLYYEIGKYLSNKLEKEKWGSKVIDSIAEYIKKEYPTLKGFDKRGMYRMIQFYDTYKENEIVVPLAPQISWSNNVEILYSTKTIEEKEFYIRMCIKNNYTKRELRRQISSGYYYRYMLSKDNNVLESTEKTIDEDDIPPTKILDYYSLSFLDLPNNYSEKDLRKGIVSNLKDFILELGSDFSFMGEEYRVQVGNEDYHIDLLFHNRTYNCLVAIELKIDKFKPEYLSKMNFYLEALDRQIKKENENPSVGIILCSSKDDVVVEYTLARNMSPTAIAEYSIDIIDKKMLENKVKELRKVLDKEK